MNTYILVLTFATFVSCGIVIPLPDLLEGPSSKTTLIGPDGSVISAFIPGGKIFLEGDHNAVGTHEAPLVHVHGPTEEEIARRFDEVTATEKAEEGEGTTEESATEETTEEKQEGDKVEVKSEVVNSTKVDVKGHGGKSEGGKIELVEVGGLWADCEEGQDELFPTFDEAPYHFDLY